MGIESSYGQSDDSRKFGIVFFIIVATIIIIIKIQSRHITLNWDTQQYTFPYFKQFTRVTNQIGEQSATQNGQNGKMPFPSSPQSSHQVDVHHWLGLHCFNQIPVVNSNILSTINETNFLSTIAQLLWHKNRCIVIINPYSVLLHIAA